MVDGLIKYNSDDMCGFFPGSIYALLERAVKYPHFMGKDLSIPQDIRSCLYSLARSWSRSLYSMAFRTDMHDISFIIMPALKQGWELFRNKQSLQLIIQAAKSLVTRYVLSAKIICSWDVLVKKDITIID